MRKGCDTMTASQGRRDARPTLDRAGSETDAPWRALLISDWERALFMHFEVPPAVLRRIVPFELDLFEGRAFVSLVAFTMRGIRPARGGRLARWLCAPVAEQRFLNLRTYVRHRGEPGIFFIAEWISHGLCVPFGPITYGLPYRWGRLRFEHEYRAGTVRGRVVARRDGSALEYEARPASGTEWNFSESEADGLDEFLIERYAAFTEHCGRRRRFRIRHEPWRQAQADVELIEDGLLQQFAPWWREAKAAGANFSTGAVGVEMGRPQSLDPADRKFGAPNHGRTSTRWT